MRAGTPEGGTRFGHLFLGGCSGKAASLDSWGWLMRWAPPHRCPKFRRIESFKGGLPGHSAEGAGEAEHEGEEAITGARG